MGGSMGTVVGEKFARACDSAAAAGVPLVSVTASGGARMQEGILALMQLPKTVVAVEELHDAGCALISRDGAPDDRRRARELREPRRRPPRRAGRADVVRRPARRRSRRRARSCPTTSASPSRTSASATSTRSSRGPSCDRPSRSCCGSSEMASEAELRDRSGAARASWSGLDLLRGARLSGELERLQRQLDRIEAEPTDEEIWRSVELARHEDRPYTLDYVERLLDDWFELHGDRGRARRRRDRHRARPARRPHGRADRPPEGPRHQGAHEAELRHGLPRGLPQGDARDGARRPARLSARHARRHARAPTRASRPSSTARAARSPRSQAVMARLARPDRRRASSARAAPAARSRSRSPTAC